MIHPLRVNGRSEWKVNGWNGYWVAEDRRPSADSGSYGHVSPIRTKKQAQEIVNYLNETHSRGYDQGVYDLLMLLVDLGRMTNIDLEVVFEAMTDGEGSADVARDALRAMLGAEHSQGYQDGASDLLTALERQGRLLPASKGRPWTREDILASLTAKRDQEQ